MNEKMIESLQRALDHILGMSEEELFADFGKPESKYYFANLALAEKLFCGPDKTELLGKIGELRVTYKRSPQVELDIPTDTAANYNHVDFLCAA